MYAIKEADLERCAGYFIRVLYSIERRLGEKEKVAFDDNEHQQFLEFWNCLRILQEDVSFTRDLHFAAEIATRWHKDDCDLRLIAGQPYVPESYLVTICNCPQIIFPEDALRVINKYVYMLHCVVMWRKSELFKKKMLT